MSESTNTETNEQPPALIPPCAICKQPLSLGELNLNRRWHFDCEACSVCKQSMSGATAMIEKCISQGKPIAHTVCSEMAAIRELKEKKIPYTLEMIQAINNEILVIRHDVAPSEGDLQQLFELSVALRELAANVSNMLSAEKAKINIKESRHFAELIDSQRKEKAAATRKEAEAEAVKEEKRLQREAEKADPQLALRRKAIEATMKNLKMSKEQAEKYVDAMQAQIGK